MKKILIPTLGISLLAALVTMSRPAFALGGGGGPPGSGGGGAGGHLSDGTIFGGGYGSRLNCDFETGCTGVGGDGGKP